MSDMPLCMTSYSNMAVKRNTSNSRVSSKSLAIVESLKPEGIAPSALRTSARLVSFTF